MHDGSANLLARRPGPQDCKDARIGLLFWWIWGNFIRISKAYRVLVLKANPLNPPYQGDFKYGRSIGL